MRNSQVRLESRKIKNNQVVEVYRYVITHTKDEFFKHYKTMQQRHFKNDRTQDFQDGSYLFVTYIKNILATTPVKKNKKGVRS